MIEREKAEQIHALLKHPEHADQAVAILESLDDDVVKRQVLLSFRSRAAEGGRWQGTTAEVRALIACAGVLVAIERELQRVQLENGQLGLPGLAPLLQFARELVVYARTRGQSLGELAVLPPLPHVNTILLNEVCVDLSALVASPHLSDLSIFGCEIEDARLSLHPMAPLRVLRLHDAPRLTSLLGLEHQVQLEWLEVTGAPVRDVTPLASLSRLRMLDLRNCPLTTLEPLRGLRELRALALAGTGMTPDDVPTTIRPYATWSPEPRMKLLGERPVHPDAGVV